MLTRLYIALWVIFAAAAAVTYLTGNMNDVVLVAFGFVAFGMIFMGMISVLPTSVHDSLGQH